MSEAEITQNMQRMSLNKQKQKKRKQTEGQKLRNHLLANSGTVTSTVTMKEVLNAKIDRVIAQYFIEVLENQNLNLARLCKTNMITVKQFKERYLETRNEPFKPILVRSSEGLKQAIKRLNEARFALKENKATPEQIQMLINRRNGIKKGILSKYINRYGYDEGSKKYDEWLLNYEQKDRVLNSAPVPQIEAYKKKRNEKGGALNEENDDNQNDDNQNEIYQQKEETPLGGELANLKNAVIEEERRKQNQKKAIINN